MNSFHRGAFVRIFKAMSAPRLPRSSGLSPEEAAAEAEFATAIEADVEGHLESYESRFGKIINTDSAKLLYPPYADDPELRVKYSRAVYGPAKWLMNELFDRRARSPLVKKILFMAGGTASGKSSCAEPTESALRDADVIVDGTLSNAGLAKKQISEALSRKKVVRVIYIHCDVRTALRRAVRRALEINRTLSLDVFAGSHFHCRRTILELADTFTADPRFRFTAIDNSGDLREIPSHLAANFVTERKIHDLASLIEKVHIWFNEICDEYEEEHGRPIPNHIRSAFLTRGRNVSNT